MNKSKYKLKIHSCPINLKFVDEIVYIDPETEEESRPYGSYSLMDSLIKVVGKTEDEFKKRVVLHELIHAHLIPYSLDLQEHAIDVLAFGLIDFAKQNKEFFKELFDIK